MCQRLGGTGAKACPFFSKLGLTIMITLIRTADIAPGKLTEAVTFAHTVAVAVEKIAGHKLQIAMPVGGKPFTLGWIVTEPDMATYAANNAKLMADTGYINLIETGAALFLPGSVHDELWQSM
jgi:hypothetical protein